MERWYGEGKERIHSQTDDARDGEKIIVNAFQAIRNISALWITAIQVLPSCVCDTVMHLSFKAAENLFLLVYFFEVRMAGLLCCILLCNACNIIVKKQESTKLLNFLHNPI